MIADRTEQLATGAAVAGHAALLAALYFLVPEPEARPVPPPPAMEVSFVDEAGLQSAAATAEPSAASFAPELGAPEEAPPEAAEQPAPEPAARPIPEPAAAQPRPSPRQAAADSPRAAEPRRDQPSRERTGRTNRGSRIGDDLLKGLGDEPASRSERPSGAVMSASALAGIIDVIKRQVLPCARLNVNPGPGANQIRVRINLRLRRDGTLSAAPRVLNTSGVNDGNARYEERVKDLAIAAFTHPRCSPLRDLPAELYRTPSGGWGNITFTYSLP